MDFVSPHKDLSFAQNEAKKFFNETDTKPKVLSVQNFSTFCGNLRYSFKLILEEKEILFFAMLQWLVIGVAYVMWLQMLDWIPDSLWDEVKKSNNRDDSVAFDLINLVLLGWSSLIVIAASYPISLFNAAITAAHYLRNSNQTSTINKCLNLAFKNLGRLWIFTAIDAWITVTAIIDRLPKKREKRTALDELLYYAWKIGTIGVLPALVAGKGYTEAAKDSLFILKNKPGRAIGIRMGYSLICWIIGIISYIGATYYFFASGGYNNKANEIYNFYLLMAAPIVIAVGITMVLVRPFFLIMISKLYTDVIPIQQDVTALTNRKSNFLGMFFSILLTGLLVLCLFGEQLGFRSWIESLAAKDIYEYRELIKRYHY